MAKEITRLRDLSKEQVRSGVAAWLGWLFDGLDMHLYTLVAVPFVASLMALPQGPEVDHKASIIQAAFLVGWALGGAFFGRVGDLLGRRRALILTILTYACFTQRCPMFEVTTVHRMPAVSLQLDPRGRGERAGQLPIG